MFNIIAAPRLDLFSGIGGFALAAQWRWGDKLHIVGFCEIEKYAQKVLKNNSLDFTKSIIVSTMPGNSE